LAGLPPVSGLYTALISTLLYSLFGTSTYSQLSSNLVLSFFVRNLLERFSTPHDTIYLINQDEDSKKWSNLKAGSEQIDYAVTVTFMASAFVALIYASRLRFLFSFVFKHLLTGFSFGLTIRVLFSQINHILHVKGHSCISELSFTVSFF
jgi:MFS superfamily sulfate permease-like transporter